MDADEAVRGWGSSTKSFADWEALDAHVQQVARMLAADGPPLVFASIKETAREAEGRRFQDAMNLVTKRQLPTVDILYDSKA